MSCQPCPAGQRVLHSCNSTHPTRCIACSRGTFSDRTNKRRVCQRCQRCRRKELIKERCSEISNTVCECRPGYIYQPPKPCFKCPQGFVAKNNRCLNTTESSTVVTDTPEINVKRSNILIFGMVSGIFIVIIALTIAFRIVYKRRSRRLPRNGVNPPDVLKDIKTPPLPPKLMRRRNENAYGPAPTPQVCRPLVEKKLISRHLPFSLVHDMNMLMTTTHEKNYKHLAGELGYNYAFVKSLSTKAQPLETLMDEYMSGENPTKERLYEALVAIDRHDVAQMVWEEL